MGWVTAGSTRTSLNTRRSCSTVTPPGRSTVGISPAKEITVDSSPTPQLPPSTIASTRPIRSSIQCCAVVGLGLPDKLAEGAAIGLPLRRISSLAIRLLGKRIATVSSPPETTSGTCSVFGRTIVNGPGQNSSASLSAAFGISLAS